LAGRICRTVHDLAIPTASARLSSLRFLENVRRGSATDVRDRPLAEWFASQGYLVVAVLFGTGIYFVDRHGARHVALWFFVEKYRQKHAIFDSTICGFCNRTYFRVAFLPSLCS